MSLKSQIGYKFTCDICAAKFKTQLDLDAHLFNSSCERELKKQGETMTTPLKVTPAEAKRLARNLRGKKPKKNEIKTIDIIGMMKTAYSVTPLDNNKFKIKYGNHKEVIIAVERELP